MQIYIPTVYGDVNIHPGRHDPKKVTEVTTTKLTKSEKAAVEMLLKQYEVEYESEELENQTFCIGENFAKVHTFLTKRLKADRKTVTALKLEDGALSELHDEAGLQEAAAEAQKKGKEAKAVTTTVPRRGCPMPAYTPREIRAGRVLTQFLNPVQLEDFERVGAFAVIGGDTGHRYRVCHRYSKILQDNGHFVRDLDTGQNYCNEISELPPSEETLAILVMLSCRETWWLEGMGNEDRPPGMRFAEPVVARTGRFGAAPDFWCTECGWRGSMAEAESEHLAKRVSERGAEVVLHEVTCPNCASGLLEYVAADEAVVVEM